jgi:hypothetical protein
MRAPVDTLAPFPSLETEMPHFETSRRSLTSRRGTADPNRPADNEALIERFDVPTGFAARQDHHRNVPLHRGFDGLRAVGPPSP